MSVTPQAFHFHLNQLANVEKFLIAYSGGIDSHVLLHLCAQLKNSPSGFKQSFYAVYIDHGLSSESKKWGVHCQHTCFELDIPLTIIEVDGSSKKRQSPEASARIARYQAFSQLLEKNECLLTAQHLDDQAETLLLQLLRGSGTKGLSSMPRIKNFAGGYLCRPMLDYKKHDILSYAEQHQLQWIEDESNREERYERNHIRHTVFPLLEKRWPSVQKNFARSAELLGESQFLLDKMAEDDIQSLFFVNERKVTEYDKLLLKPACLLIDGALTEMHETKNRNASIYSPHYQYARLNNVLRHWININHFPLPSKKILAQIVISVIGASEDRVPLVAWKRDSFHCQIRRYRDKLYLLNTTNVDLSERKNKPSDKDQSFVLLEDQILELKQSNSLLKLVSSSDSGIKKAGFIRQKLLSEKIILRFRKGGERFSTTLNGQSKSLKHWFQEQGIPPWERDLRPLIYWGDELIQVGNDIVNQSLTSGDKGDSLIICWINSDSDEFSIKKR
ncbi:MAG: tRNA lysidine(34) synthetase TilS [gamma proteobacterium symbiont of Taylorina sp.]|nr:tRNA lysidine(34) synthetase TilS [gamma proteobacterium symbiont of Taylorina sp.]